VSSCPVVTVQYLECINEEEKKAGFPVTNELLEITREGKRIIEPRNDCDLLNVIVRTEKTRRPRRAGGCKVIVQKKNSLESAS
jgi:hypothetical protein